MMVRYGDGNGDGNGGGNGGGGGLLLSISNEINIFLMFEWRRTKTIQRFFFCLTLINFPKRFPLPLLVCSCTKKWRETSRKSGNNEMEITSRKIVENYRNMCVCLCV